MKCKYCDSGREASPGVVFCVECYQNIKMATDEEMNEMHDAFLKRQIRKAGDSGELDVPKLVSMLGGEELGRRILELSKALAIIAGSEEAAEPRYNTTTGKVQDGKGFSQYGHENCVRLANEALHNALPEVYV
jgi:hypothetical protein